MTSDVQPSFWRDPEEVQPQLLRVARDAAGLTQGEVAKELGVTQVTVSRWENHARTPSDDDLERLALLYGVTPAFFRVPAREAPLMAADHNYRRRRSVKVSDVKRLEARTNWLRIGAGRLLSEVDVDPTLEIPDLSADDHPPAQAARELRTFWQVPIGPIDNLTRLLEMAGVVVILDDFPATGLDGVSMWAGPWPILYLNQAVPMDRRRFTMTHELGHLILHRNLYFEEGEEQANQFAAEFLAPADQIRPQLRQLTLRRAADLKLHWRIAISALIQRAKDVDAISDRDATRLHKQRSARGWTKHEPFSNEIPEEQPTTLPRVRDVLESEGFTREDLADRLFIRNLEAHPAFALRPERRLRIVQ